MDLSDRKRKILRAVIESYIQNAEPVGSKAIVENAGLGVSSATVRNEMADLEALGLAGPAMNRVFSRVRALGVDIDPAVYTVEQAKEAFLKAYRGKEGV